MILLIRILTPVGFIFSFHLMPSYDMMTGDRYGKTFSKKLMDEFSTFDDPALNKKIREKKADGAVKKESGGVGGFWGRRKNN